MSEPKRSYKQLETLLTIVLILTTVDFIIFLLFAGAGVIWVKVITAIFAIGIPVLCLAFLILIGEWLRQRSLWLTTGFGSILVCTIVSLICNFPSPLP
ncbi:MAG: hypothetical protein E7448_02135 [Ruminococcaceae bacterium]|nr:hypothetical protein [Oscillospiraceae bacterium]